MSSDLAREHELHRIEELIEHETRAWEAGDAVAYSQAVRADCVFTNIFGQVFVGNHAFEQQHARIFAGIYRGSRLQQTIEHWRLARPDVALVETSIALSIPPTPLGRGSIMRTKLAQVLVRKAGVWQIILYHNVEERPVPTL